jgi:hypothetical protein
MLVICAGNFARVQRGDIRGEDVKKVDTAIKFAIQLHKWKNIRKIINETEMKRCQ